MIKTKWRQKKKDIKLKVSSTVSISYLQQRKKERKSERMKNKDMSEKFCERKVTKCQVERKKDE